MWGLSPQFWQAVVSLANITALVGGVAVGVALFVSAYVSSDIADRSQREADIRIAEAQSQGEEAREQAANANERASAANERAAALEKEAAEARLKLAQLQPRQLSAVQITRMTNAVREVCARIGTLPITAANGNQEAQSYATSLVRIFKDGGCTSDLALPIPGLKPDVVGIHVGVRDISQIPQEAGFIGAVLKAGDIVYTVNPLAADFFPNDPIVLIIGAKP